MEWLTGSEVEQINEASLQVLADNGVMFESEWARKLLVENGCSEGQSADTIRIPRELVAECVAQSPETVRLASLDGSVAEIGPGSAPLYWTGNALNLAEGRTIRPIEKADFISLCRVAQELDTIHAMVGPSLADYPAYSRGFVGARIIAQYTTKHIRPCIYTPEDTVAMVEMAQVLAGGESLAERPLVSFGFTAVSPLRWSAMGLDAFRYSSGYGLPMMVNSEPVAGATGPVTPAGALTIGNAEVLAGVVVARLLEPGRPLVFNIGFAHTMDMRTAITRTASPECALIQAAGAQLARFHGMPSASWASTESMMVDAQASYESVLTGLIHALGGVNIIWGAGNLESTRVMSAAQLVIDDELARMGSRIATGIEVNDETIARDVIMELGTQAQYLGCDHTLAHFRELVEPRLAYTGGRERWEEAGSLSFTEAAEAKVDEILASDAEMLIDEDTDAELAAIEQRWMEKLA